MYHYLSMAKNNFRSYLKKDSVRTKKYFYALRPVLACLWIEKGYGVVPTEFGKLVDRIVTDRELRKSIEDLIITKRNGIELDSGPRIPVISDFLESELERLNAESTDISITSSTEALDNLFVSTLKDSFGSQL